ncbi:uncharacterized protein LOC122019134 [Zingiber officinale]|uniref:uncharacterized protein LOC122019134 n=1 Tax=Zingiber officinale TaxID=94328 RepID=UPI001C4B1C72|nr:uncharacterized protein LOC122019134 [Zingiber officinale]
MRRFVPVHSSPHSFPAIFQRRGSSVEDPFTIFVVAASSIPADCALSTGFGGSEPGLRVTTKIVVGNRKWICELWFRINNSELTKEVTDLFIWCLTQNAECYKQWEKLYVENVGATIIVLRKLSTEWRNYSAKISPDTLKVTLKHLRAKNEDALSRNTDLSQVASIKEADKYYKTILMKLTRNFGCMKGSALVLVLGIGLFFTLSPNAELINWENINWEKFQVLFSSLQSS